MTEPWWKGGVIYQIYPRSFCDTDGDGVGDLPGIISKLPYIRDLGVDGVWISPFFKSPQRDFGYDVEDYREIDPLFGDMADFDQLLDAAHGFGLKVLVDQVYSHTSDRHRWFRDSRARANGRQDWYVWADARPDGSPPNNWLSVFGGPAWSWDTGRRQYYLHNFLREQPDLNFHCPAVQEAVLDTAEFWLKKGIDGFRLDVANYYLHDPALRDNPAGGPPNKVRPYHFQRHLYNRSQADNLAFIKKFRALLDRYDGTMAVAEVFSDHPIERAIEYTEGKDRLHTAYSFSFLHAERVSAALIRQSLEDWTSPTAWPSWSFSNHDVARVASRWGGADAPPAAAKALNALLLCLRGTAFLYQGEELGLPQADVPYDRLRDPEALRFWPDNLGRDGSRTPMVWEAAAQNGGFGTGEPWLPIDPRHPPMAVDAQQADSDSVLSFTKEFIALRSKTPALRKGGMRFMEVGEPLLAFIRGESILCIFNLGTEAKNLPADLADQIGTVLPSGLASARSEGGIRLPPYGGIIARLAARRP